MTTPSFFKHFESIDDPRINRQKKHQLPDILFITVCAVICGADNWVMIEEFGKAKEDWFTDVLSLQNGIPSHDTLGAVFSALDTDQFSDCFTRWVAHLADLSEGDIVAIDGKTLRRSVDRASNKRAIHMVSAWAHKNHLVLGQEKVAGKSNEITAIPKLLKRLNIMGSVVTIDAMGCQKAIAKQIIDQQADYLLSLKGNQGELHDDVKTFFASQTHLPSSETVSGGHGRVETRRVMATDEIDWLRQRHPQWSTLNSIIAVTSLRELNNQPSSQETRYFISSLKGEELHRAGAAIRAHWSIENNLHWVLDVAFDEDGNRTRAGNSAGNLNVIRQIALNLIKQESSSKVGVKTKRAKAGWDNRYLLKILNI